MSHTTSFTGAGFSVREAAQIGASLVRVYFTNDPLLVDAIDYDDGLNPKNYTLSGPAANKVVAVHIVSDDTQAVELELDAPLVDGNWTVTVSNVINVDGVFVSAPFSATFIGKLLATITPLGQGAENYNEESILRKHLSPAFVGKGWDSIIAALAVGDKHNRELAESAFDQLFISTASGLYLDRKAADEGVKRPANIGISDDVFRELVIKTGANKLTLQSILEVLEIYYGSEATRASMISSMPAPYRLVSGDTLIIDVDSGIPVRIVFENDDFSRIGEAQAIEVANAITRTFKRLNKSAFAEPFSDPYDNKTYVRIYSGSLGTNGYVRILGGRAQNIFKFPTQLQTTQNIGTQWSPQITNVAGRVRFTWVGGPTPNLINVNSGDYVNIYGVSFAESNRGSFKIIESTATYFEIENTIAVNQGTVTQLEADDITFHSATKASIQTSARMATAIQSEPDSVDVILPATTEAIGREETTAAYLQADASVSGVMGPYIFDPNDGLGITGIATTTTQTIIAGKTYKTINVQNASEFPDEVGYLVFGFGTEEEISSVKYVGRISNTELLIDPGFIFPYTLSVGTDVTLLVQRGAYVPNDTYRVGSFYLTAAAAGRVAAEETVKDIVASGINVNVTIVYPGDVGLGNEGRPSSGTQKLSDKVSVWGSDELDEELDSLRGE